ncbi:MAG TPA: hypothetical protein VMV94_16865 [Phycisphaerae bacterium]|nr:hypothetical protein [Phycisphaerae bacterium]
MASMRSLAAAHAIYDNARNSRSPSIPADISPDAAVTLALESWVSLLAYYVDGLFLDTMTVTMPNPEAASTATARLEAERPDDAARLRELEARVATGTTTQPAPEPGTPAYYAALRAQAVALQPPLNIPIRTSITISLVQEAGEWRVVGLQIGPGSMPSAAIRLAAPSPPPPTTAPAGSPAPSP